MGRIIILLVVFITLVILGCKSESNASITPHIELISISKDTMVQGITGDTDSLFITLSFTDGDGDLGNGRSNPDNRGAIVRQDSRDPDNPSLVILQEIPQSGLNRGIEGDLIFKVPTECCIFEDGSVPCGSNPNQAFDSFTLDIHVVDLAGNKSNIVTTTPITLICTN